MQTSAVKIRRDLEDLQKTLASIGKRRAVAGGKFKAVEAPVEDDGVETVPRTMVALELQPTWLSEPPLPLTAVRLKFAALVAAHSETPPTRSTESLDSEFRQPPVSEHTNVPVHVEEVPTTSPSYTIARTPSSHEILVGISSAHLISAPLRTPSASRFSQTTGRISTPGLQPEQTPSHSGLTATSMEPNMRSSLPEPIDKEHQNILLPVTEGLPSPKIADEKHQQQSSLASPDAAVDTVPTSQPATPTHLEDLTPITLEEDKEGETSEPKPQAPHMQPSPPPPDPTRTHNSEDKDLQRIPRSMQPSSLLQRRFPVEEVQQTATDGIRLVSPGRVRKRLPPVSANNTGTLRRASLKPVMGTNKVSQMTKFWSQIEKNSG